MKSIILTFSRAYLLGYRSGGPIRTLVNMDDRLGAEFDFRIISLDRDLGDSSGVGFIGFAYFWFRSLRDAVFARKEPLRKIASAIVVFVTSLSLVEGYLANVASFVTVVAYVSAGVCFYENRNLRKRTYANMAR